jgi:cbb3-type cytochrome oxidase subunit 3
MESSWLKLAEGLKDPLLIFVLLVFALLFYVIVILLKHAKEQIEYERELIHELNNNSQTLVRLTTLIETLVHGRGGQNAK